MRQPKILVVEDDLHMLGFLKDALTQSGFSPLLASDLEDARGILARTPVDLAILDYKLPHATSGLELARRFRQHGTPVILITGHSTEELAIEALREGINDYFPKPFLVSDLLESIQRLLHFWTLGNPLATADITDNLPDLVGGHLMVGESPSIRQIKSYIRKVAETDSNVLITGETGTGKELVAELIHKNSHRAQKSFICLNCAAIPDTLTESELFGYERGAFTGAYAAYGGKLKQADGGTILLDEIGDMSLSAQAKLLRALDSKTIQRVGGRKDETLDVRFIAATNQDLEGLMACGRFRRDLYYRLNVSQTVLPPLRDRKADIPLLLCHFTSELGRRFNKHVGGIAKEALDRLLQYDWPGNVRELRNVIEACLLNLSAGMIDLAHIPGQYQSKLAGCSMNEKESILSALFSTRWNKSKAAQKLHWSRMTLYRKLARYHIISSRGKNEGGTPMISDSKL